MSVSLLPSAHSSVLIRDMFIDESTPSPWRENKTNDCIRAGPRTPLTPCIQVSPCLCFLLWATDIPQESRWGVTCTRPHGAVAMEADLRYLPASRRKCSVLGRMEGPSDLQALSRWAWKTGREAGRPATGGAACPEWAEAGDRETRGFNPEHLTVEDK